jgi:putative endonuclease
MANKTRSTIYIGMTNDLARRVGQHQNVELEGFTKTYHLNRLVYYEVFYEVLAAIAREKQLKRWRREKKNALIATLNPAWCDISPQLNQRPLEEKRGSSTSLCSAQNDSVDSLE